MSTLSASQIASLTQKFFGDLGPQVVADMTAIALAESGGNAGAHNLNPSTRDDSHGLWQINVRPDANPQYASWNLADPEQNAKAARAIYDEGGYGPWSTWGSGDALAHWDDAAQAVTGLYTGSGAPTGKQNAIYKFPKGQLPATLQQGGTSMVTSSPAAAPLTVNTGQDITKLYYWVLQQMQQLGLNPSSTTGYYPSELSGGAPGTYSPTLANSQFQQQYQAQRDDANRNYGLDLQRFGLDYANTAYSQALASANLQLQQNQLEVSKQGPGDWLKYNYLINNQVAPPSATVTGSPTAPSVLTPTVSGAAPAPAPQGAVPGYTAEQAAANRAANPHWDADIARAASMSGAYTPPPAPPQSSGTTAIGTALTNPNVPDASGRNAQQVSQDNAQTVASFGNIPKLAFGGESAPQPMQGDVMMPGESEFSDVPQPPQGGFIAWLRQLYEADMASQGGSSMPGGGMNAAIIGDPQRPGVPNKELAVSAAPIHVTPLNQMSPEERQMAEQQPHKATGGIAFGVDTPFIDKQINGGAAFTGRAEALGPYGQQPLNYTNYLNQLPSEQAMTRGYIDTPTAQGGLGGYSPDELERGRRSQYAGVSFGPVGYSA